MDHAVGGKQLKFFITRPQRLSLVVSRSEPAEGSTASAAFSWEWAV